MGAPWWLETGNRVSPTATLQIKCYQWMNYLHLTLNFIDTVGSRVVACARHQQGQLCKDHTYSHASQLRLTTNSSYKL